MGELQFFAGAPGLRGTLPTLCQQGITVVKFLATLTPSEREERIYLLNSLDGIPGQMAITVTVNASGAVGIPRLPRPIFLNPQFTEFATGPLERIERYVRTGFEDTVQEREVGCQRWQETRAFHESDVYKRARDVTWAKQKDPEEVVAAVSALCEAMYDRVAKGDLTVEIGYWTNSLTANLVKLKRFQETLQWFKRLDAAPAAIRNKTTASMAETMEKRLARCVAALNAVSRVDR